MNASAAMVRVAPVIYAALARACGRKMTTADGNGALFLDPPNLTRPAGTESRRASRNRATMPCRFGPERGKRRSRR